MCAHVKGVSNAMTGVRDIHVNALKTVKSSSPAVDSTSSKKDLLLRKVFDTFALVHNHDKVGILIHVLR